MKYGKNLTWFLSELSLAEVEQFETGAIEMIGENEQGQEGSVEIEVTDLALAAKNRIEQLEAERKLLLDRAAISICNSNIIHNQVVANQSAIIDSCLNESANAGMLWVKNGLMGPGHLNAALEQVENKVLAQDYFNEHELPILPHKDYVEKVESWLKEELAK